ncbi:glycosyltransferase-like domain-containing protein 1 [Acanthaster planci]|uniref:tRNA-queuosine alpha-mannosyltransferase n=1 Tax=Acanthaster planci TaxID=133434 RepID=A0A8B7YRL8_ACAPL|nr:glycosyltransferase-like domain-containing protein 1 [Acanthaster planci]XP_022095924.1 glycosyltransferase-like domain-containing protein 1 [Acanthaster planci]
MDPLFSEAYQTLIIEPFYGGSHQQLVDLLMANLPYSVKHTLPATKWHWKARTSALHFAQVIPRSEHYRVLFSSSVLNLAELVAMRTDLAGLHKVLYFHENQLVYPVRKQQDRDFQYGYNQIISCLIADTILFNSAYNMESFLTSIDSFLSLIPVSGYKSKGMHKPIRPKCRVLYFPLQLPELDTVSPGEPSGCQPFLPGQNIRRVQSEDPAEGTTGSLRDSDPRCALAEDTDGHEEDWLDTAARPKFGNFRYARRVSRENLENDKKGNCVADAATRRKQKSSASRSREKEDTMAQSHDQAQSHDKAPSHDKTQSHDTSHLAAGERRAMWRSGSQKPLHILWAHRWEHDKNPDLFLHTLMKLHDAGLEFRVSVLGEHFNEVPEIFAEAKAKLQDRIVDWGYQSSKEDYYRVLFAADVAVSTADHEFFGVAMLEAVHLRCYPLCPNCLVYPEIFPKQYLYNTSQQLFKRLREFCRHPQLVRKHDLQVDVRQYSWEVLKHDYLEILSSSSATVTMKTFPRSSFEYEKESNQSVTQQNKMIFQAAGRREIAQPSATRDSKALTRSASQEDRAVPQSTIQRSKALAQLAAHQNKTPAIEQPKPVSLSTTQQAKAIALSATEKYKQLHNHPPSNTKH